MKKLIRFALLLSALIATSMRVMAVDHGVTIQNSEFSPASIIISVGDKVIWTQLDEGLEHTVTSGVDGEHDGIFDSGYLSHNQTFERTFTSEGSYPYFCGPHYFSMMGTVTVQGGGPTPPTVSITSPSNNATFPAPTNITIEATASATDATITKVEFYSGTNSLGAVTSAPYRIITPFPNGTHNLTAQATDSNGSSSSSTAITITVQGAGTRITNAFAQRIAKGDLTIELQEVASGMAAPMGFACPDDGTGRLFVFDQAGLVYVIQGGIKLATPMLDARPRMVSLGGYQERGLLGLAVHPNFAANPYIYTYTSETNAPTPDFPMSGGSPNHQSVITEWRIDNGNANIVDPSSRRQIMRIDQPQSNHNGGGLRFGPDGYLYIALGDGGSADDQGTGHSSGGNGQDKDRVYGKMLRIAPRGNNSTNGQYGLPADNPFVDQAGLDEIYAWGFRNPYTFSFDRFTGELYVGDVGQNQVEELNRVFKGGNYGWPIKEGGFFFDPDGGNSGFITTAPVRTVPHDLVDPIAQYDHDDGLAIVSGYMYRGSKVPGMLGRYVTGDWGSFGTPSGRLYYLDGSELKEFRIGLNDRSLGIWIKGFGEDTEGEIYVCGSTTLGPSGTTGVIYKIVPLPSTLQFSSVSNSPNHLNVRWQNGVGPFVTQAKTELSKPFWQNSAVTTNVIASLTNNSPAQYFRVADLAGNAPIPFTTHLTGAAERPTPVNTTGTGTAILSLEGNTLHFNIYYSGLSSSATAAHIHGAATVSQSAGVLIDLGPFNGGSWGTNGVLFGSMTLTPQQKALILDGRTYINVHSVNFGSGEIRGQIAPMVFTCTLDGSSERPTPVVTPGIGSGILLLAGNQLTVNISYRNLTTAASAAHIHGPASDSQTGGVLLDLGSLHGGSFSTNGYFAGTTTLTADQLGYLLEGRLYVNVHSSTYPGGEIRGQLLARSTAIPLTVPMSGDSERPNPVVTSGTGSGSLFLEGNRLHFELGYNNLSVAATAAHIHGPADTTVAAGVLIDLAPFRNVAFGTRGAFSGQISLTDTQRALLMQARTYINVHTTQNPGGEIRGQTTPCLFQSTLLGASVRPDAVLTSGNGAARFLLVDRRLYVNASFSKLQNAATSDPICGPASTSQTSTNLVSFSGLPSIFNTNGGTAGSLVLGSGPLATMIDGLSYLTIQTTVRTNGELRGQIRR
jgi:glucose/arabinose dehydrogenase/plastocyanin